MTPRSSPLTGAHAASIAAARNHFCRRRVPCERTKLKDDMRPSDDLVDRDQTALPIARVETHLVRPLAVVMARRDNARGDQIETMTVQGVTLREAHGHAVHEYHPVLCRDGVSRNSGRDLEEAMGALHVHELIATEAVDDEITTLR